MFYRVFFFFKEDIFRACHAVNCFPRHCFVLRNDFLLTLRKMLHTLPLVLSPLLTHTLTHSLFLSVLHTHTSPHTALVTRSLCISIYHVVSWCACWGEPCLCVLGLFVPCGPVMRCPPACNCHLAYSDPTVRLPRTEWAQGRRRTCIYPPPPHWGGVTWNRRHTPFQANIWKHKHKNKGETKSTLAFL